MSQDRSADIQDLFSEIIHTGMEHAAAALNRLLRHEIRFTLPAIRIFNEYGTFRDYLESRPSDKTIIVSETFSGELEGTGVLMFPVSGGKTLVNLLIPGTDPAEIEKFNVLELDAIAELGNLIINAVQSSLGDITGLGMSSSVPRILHQDRPILIVRELKENTCFILCEVIFLAAGAHVEAMVCLVYNDLNLQMILDRLP